MHILGQNFVWMFKMLHKFSKGMFEISHKLLNPAKVWTPKNMHFTDFSVIYEIFELWCHKPLWDGPNSMAATQHI